MFDKLRQQYEDAFHPIGTVKVEERKKGWQVNSCIQTYEKKGWELQHQQWQGDTVKLTFRKVR